jgi:hypothetical protein
MNEINVIAPYKHQGMWVFDDSRVGLVQEPFVVGAIRGSIGLSLISRTLIGDLPWSFPVQSFLGTNIAWTGGAAKAAAIGITRPHSIWKAGYARRCFGIFQRRRSTSMFKSKLGNDGHSRKVSGFDCYSLMALLRKLARSLKHWTIPTRIASRHSLT